MGGGGPVYGRSDVLPKKTRIKSLGIRKERKGVAKV